MPKWGDMPDMASIIVRRCVGNLSKERACCSKCHRTPLVGERLHETDGGRQLCELCVLDLPADRHVVSVRRMHASERHLAVERRAAA
ncbi:MAG: hypothetical protein GXY03_07820 [Solirubrobacterales bacterium]|nr:hypothetical protein [Solirubrobacterales bacterium]